VWIAWVLPNIALCQGWLATTVTVELCNCILAPVVCVKLTDISSMYRVQGVSFPRSGHHLLVKCVKQYFGKRLGYCGNVFRGQDFLSDGITLQKNHDFDLILPISSDARYLIQYRHPLEAIASWYRSLRKNHRRKHVFPRQKLISCLFQLSAQLIRLDDAFWAVFEAFGRVTGHTSGQSAAHAASIAAGRSRLPRRIRL
jgi:hypothetical protein